jgi:hypothetical protein
LNCTRGNSRFFLKNGTFEKKAFRKWCNNAVSVAGCFHHQIKDTMKRSLPMLMAMVLVCPMLAQDMAPVLSDVTLSLDGSTVLIQYDLSHPQGTPAEVRLFAGLAGTGQLDLPTGSAAGAVGLGVEPGTGKTIVWEIGPWLADPTVSGIEFRLVAEDPNPVDIQAVVDGVDSNRIRNDLAQLEGIRHRNADPGHLAAVQARLVDSLSAWGWLVSEHLFPYGSYTGRNILAQRPGITSPDTAFLVGAHYDGVAVTPGADDNASGVAGCLEVMRVLAPYHFRNTLRMAAFDLEEVGLVGSGRYVKEMIPDEETIAGFLNLEMVGYYTEAPNSQTLPAGFQLLYPDLYDELAAEGFRGDFLNNVGEAVHSVALMSQFAAAAAEHVPSLKVKSLAAHTAWQTLTPDLGRSDHAPFWVDGIPALMLTDGSEFRNPNYHTPNDTLGSLHFTFLSSVVKATVATLATLADIRLADTWEGTLTWPVAVRSVSGLCRLVVVPNPAATTLQLRWPDCLRTDAQVLTLSDMDGKVVHRQSVAPDRTDHCVLQVSDLPRGSYVLRLGSAQAVVLLQ